MVFIKTRNIFALNGVFTFYFANLFTTPQTMQY